MNNMRKLMETAAELDESVYFDPKIERKLHDTVGTLELLIEEYELDVEDVVAFVERELYNKGPHVYNQHNV